MNINYKLTFSHSEMHSLENINTILCVKYFNIYNVLIYITLYNYIIDIIVKNLTNLVLEKCRR